MAATVFGPYSPFFRPPRTHLTLVTLLRSLHAKVSAFNCSVRTVAQRVDTTGLGDAALSMAGSVLMTLALSNPSSVSNRERPRHYW